MSALNWIRAIAALAVVGLCLSCSAVRQVVPLEPGENAVHVSLGGPVTQYIGDAYAPLPLLSLGYNRGLTRTLDLEAGFDLTHTLYKVPKIDAGVNWRPWSAERWRPSLIVSPRIHVATDFQTDVLFYPALSLTCAWKAGRVLHPYIGIENFFELQQERDDGLEQENHWLIAPYAGLVAVRGRWQFGLEARVYTPNLDNDYGRGPVNWGFGDNGMIGFFLAVTRTFGAGRRGSTGTESQ